MDNQNFRRNSAMDLVRLTALLCVVSIHFFLNTEYYDLPVTGLIMYTATIMRTGFMICVPLFLLLSGYLLKNKTATRSYYTKLIYTVVIYLLASILCFLYRKHPFSIHDLIPSIVTFIDDTLNFSSAPYSWYVEMYIGLFLLIPYLNTLYNALSTKKEKQNLILSLLLLTSLPKAINIFRLNPSWWLNPSSSSFYYHLLPTYWIDFYPVTYYFIGAYLRDYPLKFSLKKTAVLTGVYYLLNGLFNIYRSDGLILVKGTWHDYGSLFIVIQAVLVFSLISKINCQRLSDRTTRFLSYLSSLCFGAYLVSYIFDSIIYDLVDTFPENTFRLDYFFLTVPFVYVCSLLLSALMNWVYSLGSRLCAAVFHRKASVS